MCGIAGIFLSPAVSGATGLDALPAMLDTLRHRGPDGDGVWFDREAGIGLGHRRLAIVDLSDAGRQPMHGWERGLVATYNGEIYNFRELRADLEARGCSFRGTGDTEVMLAAFECFGVEAALHRFAGMFAIALWDRAKRELHLVRDRLGKKPLYVAMVKGALVFASELRALRAFPGFDAEIDPAAVSMLLRYGWIPDHMCIWDGVFKLPPGSRLRVSADDLAAGSAEHLRSLVQAWWSLEEMAKAGQAEPLPDDDAELVGQLDDLLRVAVGQRMIADVPLGALLSGGVDSATVVALMQAQSAAPVRTFTIGFEEAGYDEAGHAERVARHLGTVHSTLRLSPAEARAVIPDLPSIWDEPFADESQIPTFLVARLARRYVKVALSGDGGDECFGGYRRHVMASRLGAIFGLPRPLRMAGGAALRLLHPGSGGRWLRAMPIPASVQRSLAGRDLQKLAALVSARDEASLYDNLLSLTDHPAVAAGRPTWERADAFAADLPGRLMYRDLSGYLPGDVLVKVDRASMAVGLEARCPLLDHRVVEFALRLPAHTKVRGPVSKWLLRQVLRRYVPDALFERPKAGFDVPIGAWLIGPLRPWVEDVFATARRVNDGTLDQQRVAEIWREHLAGRGDRGNELWAILMFQAWRASQHGASTIVPPASVAGAA
jgi:asparagine synthase (glutamine-hydrolysing)